MDDAMIFSVHEYCDDLANLVKALIKFILEISTHKCQFSRGHLMYMGLMFMPKERKPSYHL